MYGLEKEIYSQLLKLRNDFDLQGIKAEFEAEGSTFRDIMRLRRLTSRAGIDLHVKIGGVEALRDIKDCLELGVDGIIAPMVETKFGVKKFYDSFKSIYGDHNVHLSINIETRNAAEEIDTILEYSQGKIDNITLGRTDFSASYFDPSVIPDSDFTFKMMKDIGERVVKAGFKFTVGGSLSVATINKMNENPDCVKNISKLETRKIILPKNIMLHKTGVIMEALKFEELYILSKKEFSDLFIESEVSRLAKLTRRT